MRIAFIFNNYLCEFSLLLQHWYIARYPEWGFGIDVCVYICIEYITTSSCKTLCLYVFREKWVFHETISFNFFPASIWKCHALVMYCIYNIEEIKVSQENLCCIIWYVKINNCVVQTTIILCLLLQMEMIT